MENSDLIFITESDFRNRYQYQATDLLGEGGFAQVYKAYDKQFEEYVALKLYNKGEQGKYDVLHEMKDGRKFSHKNIIRVHDAFIVRFEHTGGYSFIQVGVLEFANGGSLRDFIQTKPSEERFIEVLIGILNALRYLHQEKKIIHRDLSPENILMYIEGDTWIPKIADFGISKKMVFDSLAQDQKKSTQLLGKVEYMAPEQFYPEKYGINGKISTNVDLWAFGIILYELFTHRKPFVYDSPENLMKVIHSITNDPIPDLSSIPQPYQEVITKCLEKDASKRVQDANELIKLLKKEKSSATEKIEKTVTPKEKSKPKKNTAFIIIPTFVVLIAAGLIYYFVIRDHNTLGGEIANSSPKDSIISLMGDKKFDEATLYFLSLTEEARSDPELMELYKQCSDSLKVDSLINRGEQLFQSRDWDNALATFDLVVNRYDPNNKISLSRKNRITHIKDSLENLKSKDDIVIPENNVNDDKPEPGVIYNTRIRRAPSNATITLDNVRLTDNNTIITLTVFGNPDYNGTVDAPGSEGAFFIEYNDRSSRLELLKISGVQPGAGIYKKTTFQLFFKPLPDEKTKFNLIDGINQSDETVPYWNFIGIDLIKIQ